MANIILVAGTFHGGWYWDSLADNLRKHGHRVFTPTLSGLDRETPSKLAINLDTHISDVLSVIDENHLDGVVIVGWSYGGMVITGAADRTNAKVEALIYLDAWPPKPGQSEWDLIPEWDRPNWLARAEDGLNVKVFPKLLEREPRMADHPLATKLQPLHYDQGKFDGFKKVFIHAERWSSDSSVVSPFRIVWDRVQYEPGWTFESWPCGHDLMYEAAEQVERVILETLA